jgi:hypothetical protein
MHRQSRWQRKPGTNALIDFGFLLCENPRKRALLPGYGESGGSQPSVPVAIPEP